MFLQMIYRPALLLFSPIIWFAFLGYGLSITFIVLIAVLSSYIFSVPPYNFGPEQVSSFVKVKVQQALTYR